MRHLPTPYSPTGSGAEHDPAIRVEFGVHGAYRITHRDFATEAEAETAAARWRSSNSIGSYWAEVMPVAR